LLSGARYPAPRWQPDTVVSMVTFAKPRPRAPWQDAHFVGGHPVLDLTNTVSNRSNPVEDNELLKSPADVLSWCESVGLFETAPPLTDAAARKLVVDVRDVREHAWPVFGAVSRGEVVPTEALGSLLELAGASITDRATLLRTFLRERFRHRRLHLRRTSLRPFRRGGAGLSSFRRQRARRTVMMA